MELTKSAPEPYDASEIDLEENDSKSFSGRFEEEFPGLESKDPQHNLQSPFTNLIRINTEELSIPK